MTVTELTRKYRPIQLCSDDNSLTEINSDAVNNAMNIFI
jgi:hypothetical protein